MLLEAWSQSLPDALRILVQSGHLAVQTFFLLSGFVLARTYARTRWDRDTLLKFASARLARIYPVYLLSLVLVSWFALQFLLFSPRTGSDKLSVVTAYAFLLQGWRGSLAVGWNTPAWTLSCELFFYLCFPLLFLWLRPGSKRSGGALRIGTALALSFVLPLYLTRSHVPTVWEPVHHLADFLAGIAAARIYEEIARRGWALRRGMWLYLPAFALAVAFIVHPRLFDHKPITLTTALRPLNVAILVGLALEGGWLARLLASRPLNYLGKASYSMYILHIPLLWWFSSYTLYRFGTQPPAWTSVLYLALVTAASLAAYEHVEDPANRWIRDRVAARLHPHRSCPNESGSLNRVQANHLAEITLRP